MSKNGIDIEQAFRDHAATVIARVARKVRAPHAVIEDACQFAWTQAWRYRSSLRTDTLRPWLVKVAEREAWRLASEQQAAIVEDAAERATAPASDATDAISDRLQVLDMLAAVSPQQQRVLVLWSAGYSYEEIADELAISRTAVNKALVKARARLRGER